MMQVYLPDNQPPDGLAQNLCLLPLLLLLSIPLFFLISGWNRRPPSNYLQILQSQIPPKRKKISAFPVCSQQESVQSPVIYEKRLFTKITIFCSLPISSDCNPLTDKGRDQTCFFDPIILHKRFITCSWKRIEILFAVRCHSEFFGPPPPRPSVRKTRAVWKLRVPNKRFFRSISSQNLNKILRNIRW